MYQSHSPGNALSALINDKALNRKICVGIYTRKSDATEGKSKSLQQQLDHCHRLVEHYGFDLNEANIYSEEEGQKGDWYWNDGTDHFPKPFRPELTRMMTDIEAGKIEAVLVWRSDRLYRDNGVCDAIMQVLRRKKIRFICGVRDMDVNTASGLFQASVEAANNRRWRDQISEDVRRDQQFKAELGMFSRNPSCLGFRSKGKGTQEATPIWEEISLVSRVFHLFVTGEDLVTGEVPGPLGTNGIASYLMDRRVHWPKGQKGHKIKQPDVIHESHIRIVLQNCMYVGRWRHNRREYECEKLLVPVRDSTGNIIPGMKPETVVPFSLYEAAQEKLARRQRPGKRSLTSEHLLTGLAVCARCGRPLQVHFSAYKSSKSGAARAPRANFQCNHKRGERPCPPGTIVRLQEPVLDAWVVSELAPLLACEVEAMRASAGRDVDVQSLAELERQVKEARGRETKKLMALMDVLDTEQFSDVAAQLRTEREALERRMTEVSQRLTNAERVLPDLGVEQLTAMPKSALKDALSRAVQWIALGKTGITVLTTWGTYIGADYRRYNRANPAEVANTFYLCPPTPAASLLSLFTLPDPAEFVRGRRDALGKKTNRLTDDELLPGAFSDECEDNNGQEDNNQNGTGQPDAIAGECSFGDCFCPDAALSTQP